MTTWANWRLTPSPPASVDTRTRARSAEVALHDRPLVDAHRAVDGDRVDAGALRSSSRSMFCVCGELGERPRLSEPGRPRSRRPRRAARGGPGPSRPSRRPLQRRCARSMSSSTSASSLPHAAPESVLERLDLLLAGEVAPLFGPCRGRAGAVCLPRRSRRVAGRAPRGRPPCCSKPSRCMRSTRNADGRPLLDLRSPVAVAHVVGDGLVELLLDRPFAVGDDPQARRAGLEQWPTTGVAWSAASRCGPPTGRR